MFFVSMGPGGYLPKAQPLTLVFADAAEYSLFGLRDTSDGKHCFPNTS